MNTEATKVNGPRPDEEVFVAKSFVLLQVTMLLIGVLVAAVAIEMYWGGWLQAAFQLSDSATRDIAWIPGLVGALLVVAAIWEWNSHLQWLALSREGIRWLHRHKVHSRAWDEVVKVQPTEDKEYLNGQLQYTIRGMEVHFRSGQPLVVNDVLFADYHRLASALERYASGGPGLQTMAGFRHPAGW